MKCIVLGAGVIGVTTAYYLAKAGCEVTVIERQAGPGLETSFANAGQISTGYSSPWAAPSIPRKEGSSVSQTSTTAPSGGATCAEVPSTTVRSASRIRSSVSWRGS